MKYLSSSKYNRTVMQYLNNVVVWAALCSQRLRKCQVHLFLKGSIKRCFTNFSLIEMPNGPGINILIRVMNIHSVVMVTETLEFELHTSKLCQGQDALSFKKVLTHRNSIALRYSINGVIKWKTYMFSQSFCTFITTQQSRLGLIQFTRR